ncbi:MepB family protein [Arcticibacterium luteifluviistationis]|uniref:MepB family protein n=1 Tax=Arcticibacterium luteifluviistationis TaxID=1784714 RepID=UPI001E535A49|nr:MepB family protein [Arcticibacterium luteifluviistationis]
MTEIKTAVYDKCGLEVSCFKAESESKEYDACRFLLNGKNVLCRNAKITPKKVGQFVTFWKRNGKGPIEPFNESDEIDFYVVNVKTENAFGQFVFPKSILIQKGIISTEKKEGKRAFRVYPIWNTANNKQAERTQKWQLDYFFEINDAIDFDRVSGLYQNQ